MTAQSPADLAATVQDALDLLAGYAARDESDFAVMEDGCAALDALVALCEQAEARAAFWKNAARSMRDRGRFAAGVNAGISAERLSELKRAERERDEARAHLESATPLSDYVLARAVSAEARVAQLEAALRPFAEGAEAFDTADGTYGDDPVFERIASGGHWKFTVADVRRVRAVLAGEGEA